MHRKDGDQEKTNGIQGEARSISKSAEIPMLNFLLKGWSFIKEANIQFVRGNGYAISCLDIHMYTILLSSVKN